MMNLEYIICIEVTRFVSWQYFYHLISLYV